MMTKSQPAIKVLALIEATTVIGPAKNLIEFARRARTLGTGADGLPSVELTVATFHRSAASDIADEAPNPFVAAARAAGIEVDVIGERFRFDPRVLEGLRRVVERRAPDLIQTHQVKSHFLLKLSGAWRRRPWIAYHHGYTATDLKMHLYNGLDRWSLPSAHRVVTVCQAFARQLSAKGVSPDRISVRHNSIKPNGVPVSEDEVQALREKFGIAPGERVVLAVGRFSREKAHADLVAALGHLRRTHPETDFKLLLVGDGPERGSIEGTAASHGISERLIFAGHVGDVRPFYALADVMALPSHSEGSPNVLLEAMAAGVPSVATAVGGVPEIATHEENALLVEPGVPVQMAAALQRVLSDAPLAARLAANASALVKEHYSPEAYARSTVGVYSELLRSDRAAADLV